MKKPITALALTLALSSVFAFASCNEVTTSISSSWFSNTTLTTAISDTHEHLVYGVTLDEGTNEHVQTKYENGVYTTDLINSVYTWSDGTADNVYIYTTSLALDTTYTIAGESETYHDTIDTKIIFRTSDEGLKPVSSERKVSAHSVNDIAPTSLEKNIVAYDYTITTSYNREVTEGTAITTVGDKSETKIFKIEDDFSYLDNEELFFSVRGMNIASSASETVFVYNTARDLVQRVKITNEATATLVPTFTVNGEKTQDSLTYHQIAFDLSDERSGITQTAYYAATTSSTQNTFHNVMVESRSPLPYGMGTIRYTLQNAEFTSK